MIVKLLGFMANIKGSRAELRAVIWTAIGTDGDKRDEGLIAWLRNRGCKIGAEGAV